jgi:fibronectin-binding autotransporter adhesin
MKRRALFYFLPGKFFKLLLPLLAAWPLAGRAATLDWDPAISGGTTLGGPGPWNNLTTFNWWDSTLTTQAQWNNANNDTASFGGTPGTGLVSVAGTGITAGGLIFNTGGYSLSGGTLTLAGGTPAVTVTNAGQTATINNSIAGIAGLTVNGAGTLVLTGNSGYSGGTFINSGTLMPGWVTVHSVAMPP